LELDERIFSPCSSLCSKREINAGIVFALLLSDELIGSSLTLHWGGVNWRHRLLACGVHFLEGVMTLLSFLLLLLIAGICGAIGQAIAGVEGGLLVTIAVGFIGALIGIWLAGALGLSEIFAVNIGGRTFPIIWSIIGSALFAALIGLFRRRRYSRYV
jgi:uncharacterized membrane protein YeaQ/YmgE (transglycosylase-associated protein family)